MIEWRKEEISLENSEHIFGMSEREKMKVKVKQKNYYIKELREIELKYERVQLQIKFNNFRFWSFDDDFRFDLPF